MANTGNTQQQIDYGAAANDGQGDPLRTAFIKTDDNFDAIWNAGPVGSNITIVNNTLQSNNTNGNIVLRPNGVGVIQANASIVPNATNLRDLGTADQRFRAAYIGTGGLSVDGNVTVTGNLTAGNISYTGNVFVGDLQGSVYADDSTIMVDAVDNEMFADRATFGAASVTGNVSANFFIGNGSLLTGVASTYGNANVATYLASDFGSFGANTIVTAGNIVASALDVANLTHVFPIGIQTNGGGPWEFAGNILRGPEGGSWQSAADTIFLTSPANGYITLESTFGGNVVSELFMEHSFIRFLVDNGGPEKTWQMNLSGEFSVPGDIIPQSNGTASLGNATNYWSNLWVANNTIYIGGVPLGVTGNTLTVNGEPVLSNDSNSSITTTGNITAGNIEITSNLAVGTGGNVNVLTVKTEAGVISIGNQNDGTFVVTDPNFDPSIYVAGQQFYITTNGDGNSSSIFTFGEYGTANVVFPGNLSLGDGVDSTIFNPSNNISITANTASWQFGTDGVLTAPGNIVTNGIRSDDSTALTIYDGLNVDGDIEAVGNVTANYFIGNGSQITGITGVTGNITFSNTTMSPPDGEDLFITAANSEVEITGLDFRVEVTDDVRIQGNDIVSIRNTSNAEPITIRTDYNGNDYSWEFDATGNLTTPGNIEVSGDITVAGQITGTSSASTLVLAAEPDSNTAIQLNDTVDSIIRTVANLEVRTDSSNTARTWTFDTTGNLTAPGNVQATSYRNASGVSILGNFSLTDNTIQTGNGVGGITLKIFGPDATDPPALIDKSWVFGNTGTFTAAGDIEGAYITATANIAGGNLIVTDTVYGLDLGFTGTANLATVNATGNISGANLITTGNVVGNVSGFAIGYRDIPQVSFTGNATIATTDAGKHFYSTESTDYILTIANNASQGFAVGAAISIVNQGTGNITIAQGSGVTLYLAGNATSGNRTLSTFGMATIIKVATDTWFINGTGVA